MRRSCRGEWHYVRSAEVRNRFRFPACRRRHSPRSDPTACRRRRRICRITTRSVCFRWAVRAMRRVPSDGTTPVSGRYCRIAGFGDRARFAARFCGGGSESPLTRRSMRSSPVARTGQRPGSTVPCGAPTGSCTLSVQPTPQRHGLTAGWSAACSELPLVAPLRARACTAGLRMRPRLRLRIWWRVLPKGGFSLFDAQVPSPHLSALGAVGMPHREFVPLLLGEATKPASFDPLPAGGLHDVLQWSTQTS